MNQGELKIREEKPKKKEVKRVWYRLRQVTQKLVRREGLLKSKVTEFREAKRSFSTVVSFGHGVCPLQMRVL